MHLKLLKVLGCPTCYSELKCEPLTMDEPEEVVTGTLKCTECAKTYSIEAGIPRFIESENYASSFGYQWNRFRLEQIDSINGTRLSEQRFYSETGWTPEWMSGKWILDAGCGAGRFLDVAARSDCEVVGMDISNAVDAAKANLIRHKNVHFVQASIYELPFRNNVFDGCYCIGVIQHTPDPPKSVRSLPRVLKAGGRIAVTIYERKRWTLLYSKYLLRPFTKRLDKKILLKLIKGSMPVLWPITEVLFRVPLLGRYFMFAIPVANHVDEPGMSWRQRYEWAILDTFDMLSPQYDQPQTQQEAESSLRAEGIKEIDRLNNRGLNLIGKKTQ
jgi:ubiquinone/menaquinone biosynthesis C-methylase UbiE/uncharacterized protein YbaR (Trm112 family)